MMNDPTVLPVTALVMIQVVRMGWKVAMSGRLLGAEVDRLTPLRELIHKRDRTIHLAGHSHYSQHKLD